MRKKEAEREGESNRGKRETEWMSCDAGRQAVRYGWCTQQD